MDGASWERAKELYERIAGLPEGERDSALESAAATDPEVAAEVRRLLSRKPQSGFLEPPTSVSLDPPGTGESDDGGVRGRVLGDFELLERIGRGGMGVVYCARQRSLDRFVAVKILRPFLASDRDVDRFRREAKAVAKLRHPGIVQILAVGETDDVQWYAMELVDGIDLATAIARLRDQSNLDTGIDSLPRHRAPGYFAAVARIVAEAADALQHAHDHGVVHRDVKPSNLILDRDGRVRLVDFGIARGAELGTITGTGEIAGTPHYMSPEQVRARRDPVDHRTDVYSLGVVLYELLTLERPFDGSTTRDVFLQIESREPREIVRVQPAVPRDIATICHAAIRKRPLDRYANAGRLAADLHRFINHDPIEARPYSTTERATAWVRRNRVAVVFGALLTIGIVAALGASELIGNLIHRRDLAESCARGLATPVLDALSPEQLRSLDLDSKALIVEAIDPEDASVASQLSSRLASLRDAWLRTIQEDAESLLHQSLDPGTRQTTRSRMLLLAARARTAFPDDTRFESLARIESTFVPLTVHAIDARNIAVPATVRLQEIDAVSGEALAAIELGDTPLLNRRIEDGVFRVIVEFHEGGFREYSVAPGLEDTEIKIEARRSDTEGQIAEGMIHYRGGIYTFPSNDRDQNIVNAFAGRTVHVAPFLLDRTEVSIGDYRRFLVATGYPAPHIWQYGLESGHDELPITGITGYDCTAFAAWAGKRLPTYAEWSYASRTVRNHRTPWGGPPGPPWRGNVLGENHYSVPTPREELALYLRNVWPVTEDRDNAATSEGALHMLGNVSELTETLMVFDDAAQTPRPKPFNRVVAGFAWDAGRPENRYDLGSHYSVEICSTCVDLSRGFRCARSAIVP